MQCKHTLLLSLVNTSAKTIANNYKTELKTVTMNYDYPDLLWQPWLRFFRAFSSVVTQMPG